MVCSLTIWEKFVFLASRARSFSRFIFYLGRDTDLLELQSIFYFNLMFSIFNRCLQALELAVEDG